MNIARRIAVAAVVGLALAGCGGNDAKSGHSTGTTATTAPVSAAKAALQTSAAAIPNGRPFDLELDKQKQFEVNAASNGNDFKLVIDTTGTRVLSQHQEPAPSDDVAKLQGAQVDAVKALDTAAGREPGAAFGEMEIDTNATGTVVWKVSLVRPDGAQSEYEVDAKTGAVTKR